MEQAPDRLHYIERVHEETLRYVRDLLEENERLRAAANRLEALEQETRRFSEEFAAIEAQNANLANLYVASYQLHGSVDRASVLQAIKEIVANLIGSEEMAVYEVSPDGLTLRLIASMGIDAIRWARIAVGTGPIGTTVTQNSIFIADGGVAGPAGITATIPLAVDGQVIGAIVVFHLLAHKPSLQECDREMFELLALHAAAAFHCATLHEAARLVPA